MGKAELAACGAVAIVAIALIALIWILTIRAIQDQQAEIRDRTEHVLAGQAATIAETVSNELVMIDQTLMTIQAAWKADSDSVDLTKLQATMPALTVVTDDLFISDEKNIIRQDILPKAVGQGVGAAYVTFPHGSLEQFQSDGTRNTDSLLLQNDAGQPIEARQFLMYIVRPLDHPNGWLVGASYRSQALTKLFAEASLGYNSLVALTDTRRGIVQSIVGTAARRPKTDISHTPLFDGISRLPSGIWLGASPVDGIERMHAYHRVANRDMAVVVAANWSETMAMTNNLAADTRAVAFVGSGLVLVIAAMVLWELYTISTNKRRKRAFERNRGELERLCGEEGMLSARAQLNAARLKIVVDIISDGIALFDSSLRLVQWNHPFQRGIGIEPKPEMPLDSLLRAQAEAGLFGPLDDAEAEIARRVAVLHSGDIAGVPQPGPTGETLILRGLPISEGGFMLLLNGLETWEPPPSVASSVETEEAAVPETASPAPIEW